MGFCHPGSTVEIAPALWGGFVISDAIPRGALRFPWAILVPSLREDSAGVAVRWSLSWAPVRICVGDLTAALTVHN